MTVQYEPLEMAIELMTAALDLLDAASEHDAAALLQHALSIALREPIPPIEDCAGASAAGIFAAQ